MTDAGLGASDECFRCVCYNLRDCGFFRQTIGRDPDGKWTWIQFS